MTVRAGPVKGPEDRVRHQRAVKEMYWRHRIWPAENPGIRPALGEMLSEEQIRERVSRYLAQSAAQEIRWPHLLTVDSIQAELDRMVRRTRAPEVLSELFAALDNNPFLVAECLVRPLLADRLLREQYQSMAPEGQTLETWWVQESRMTVGAVAVRSALTPPPHRYELRSALGGGCDLEAWATFANAPSARERHTAVWTGAEMIVWGGYGDGSYLDSGGSYCACSGGPVSTWYPDADGDGLGMETTAVPACAQPAGYIAIGGDCDDRYFDCTTDCTDADSDGLPACGPDCDDLHASCTYDCADSDLDLVPECRDNCPEI